MAGEEKAPGDPADVGNGAPPVFLRAPSAGAARAGAYRLTDMLLLSLSVAVCLALTFGIAG